MNNQVAQTNQNQVASRNQLIQTLRDSLYAGARADSVEMVLQYCESAGLDVMQKPVHIVPMSVKNATSGKYEFRDVVMPGIGLYRIQASRSHGYAGVTEPKFGEDVSANLGGVDIVYPKSCSITVKRMMPNGAIAEFTATELWLENYATKSRDSVEPNAMWKKRPYAQLAKCAEAQALRKAFPEVGQAPTAEEMEGKELDSDSQYNQPQVSQQAEKPAYPNESITKYQEVWREWFAIGKTTPDSIIAKINNEYTLSNAQIEGIRKLALPQNQNEAGVVDAEYSDVTHGQS